LRVPERAWRYVERMPSADSEGVRIHYELAGTGEPLVLIGGLGVHTNEYRPLIDALARHHRVLAADNRGAGLSGEPDEPYSYAVMPTAESRELARLIPGAEFGLMPGGHLAILRTAAAAYAERIDEFTAKG
jgi:3-oxoadipate enol-lactonase